MLRLNAVQHYIVRGIARQDTALVGAHIIQLNVVDDFAVAVHCSSRLLVQQMFIRLHVQVKDLIVRLNDEPEFVGCWECVNIHEMRMLIAQQWASDILVAQLTISIAFVYHRYQKDRPNPRHNFHFFGATSALFFGALCDARDAMTTANTKLYEHSLRGFRFGALDISSIIIRILISLLT